METVYIETTNPSYLTAHRSHQEPMKSHQRITQEWWDHQRARFRLYASAAARRLKAMIGIPELDVTPEVEPLSNAIVQLLQLPQKAEMDATHVAFAIVHRMDYLLTWNCTHLANAFLQKTLFEYCTYHHIHMPVICTPELLTRPQI